MEKRLSKRLGPSAKKIALRSEDHEPVSALINFSPSINRESFEHGVRGFGGVVCAWMPETNLATVEVTADHLSEVADLDGVVQVEVRQRYQH